MTRTPRSSVIADAFGALAKDGRAAFHEDLLGDLARQVLDGMQVRAGHQLLEIGSGTGWATKRLGRKAPGAQAIGVDLSPAVVAVAEESTDWTARARFECMDVRALDFVDGRFHHVFALGSLELVEDPAAALAEIRRVTAPEGRLELVLLAHAGNGAADALADTIGVRPDARTAEEWQALLAEAGFRPPEGAQAAIPLADARSAEHRPRFEPSPWARTEAEQGLLLTSGALHLRGARSAGG